MFRDCGVGRQPGRDERFRRAGRGWPLANGPSHGGAMLILIRKIDESIVIADDITVTVLEISGERVKIGIDAPRDVVILRQELQEQVRQENIETAADLSEVSRRLKNLSDQD